MARSAVALGSEFDKLAITDIGEEATIKNPVINRVSPNKAGSSERRAGPQEIPSRVQSPGKAGSSERTAATAILYRDSRGLPALKPLNGDNVMEDDILMLFQYYKCYDLIPVSTKLVVLDTKLLLKRAFYAMVDTSVRACPLWDSDRQAFVGMLTITDFIRILQQSYQGPAVKMTVFEEQRLLDWKGITEDTCATQHNTRDLIHISLEAGLLEAVTVLIENRIHRLPITDPETGNIVAILTTKPILKLLFSLLSKLDKEKTLEYTKKSIEEAGVGSYGNIKVASEKTTVIEALTMMVSDGVSALPIVTSEGRLTNIYSKFDVINLAATKSYTDLEISLQEATQHKVYFDGIHCCTGGESVLTVMERLVRADVNRLVIVDAEERVVGIVTVIDFIDFFVTRHFSSAPSRRNLRARPGRGESLSQLEEELGAFSSHSDTPPPMWFDVYC